jgi:Cytochrome oxidase assembly protein
MLRRAPGAFVAPLRTSTTIFGPGSHLRASLSRILSSTVVPRRAIHPSRPLSIPLFSPSYPRRDAASSIPKGPFLSTLGKPTSDAAKAPGVASKGVGNWLIGCGILVIGVVVVGGVTRLTESGLSITEWRPVTGILPPLNSQEWEEEFNKYKLTPEFKL